MKKALFVLLLALCLFSRGAQAAGPCAIFQDYTLDPRVTGQNLTSSFRQVTQTNMIWTCLDDYSTDVTQMRSTIDPYPNSSESFATTGAGELERIRFVLKKITGWSQWYAHTEPLVLPGVSLSSIPAQGRLLFTSGVQIRYTPFNGRNLAVVTNGTMVSRDIGASGIGSGNPSTGSNFVNGVANQVLVANTTYLVTVFDNAGVLAFDFLTSLAHTPDAASGVEVATGAPTRSVVGMVRMNATGVFQDDNGLLGVISWFNRRDKSITNGYSVNRTSDVGAYVEIHGEIRGNFITWADDAVSVSLTGAMGNNTQGAVTLALLTFETLNAEDASARYFQPIATSEMVPLAMTLYKTGLADGYHFATMLGAVSGGIGSWYGGIVGLRTSLTVKVRG